MTYAIEQAIHIAVAEETNLPLNESKALIAAIKKLTGMDKPPTAWIIEREGHLPTITHYESTAKAYSNSGHHVTPYYSRVVS